MSRLCGVGVARVETCMDSDLCCALENSSAEASGNTD